MNKNIKINLLKVNEHPSVIHAREHKEPFCKRCEEGRVMDEASIISSKERR